MHQPTITAKLIKRLFNDFDRLHVLVTNYNVIRKAHMSNLNFVTFPIIFKMVISKIEVSNKDPI